MSCGNCTDIFSGGVTDVSYGTTGDRQPFRCHNLRFNQPPKWQSLGGVYAPSQALTVTTGSARDGEKVVVTGMPKWDELKAQRCAPSPQ